MSSGAALVRFPDGTVKFTNYHGTSDILHPALRVTLAEAFDSRDWGPGKPEGEVFDVEIFTFYGGDWWWEGKATKEYVVEGVEPWGNEDWGDITTPPSVRHDGKPEWVAEIEEAVSLSLPAT